MRRILTLAIASMLIVAACSGTEPADTTTGPTTGPTTTIAERATTTIATTTTTTRPPAVATDTLPLTVLDSGIGDSYYPGLGNTGYDVDHYTLDIGFDPDTNTLTGYATIEATALDDLDRVNLDFIGFEIGELLVDDTPAEFVRSDEELTIRPATVLPAGEGFTISVGYAGTPEPLTSQTKLFSVGWSTSPTGQRFVVAEPDGARSWFPANDHPRDKATFTFLVTVPAPLTAAASGVHVDTITDLGQATWVWEMNDPMAPYLATVVIGDYEIVQDAASTHIAGIPVRNVLPPDLAAAVPDPVLRQGEMIDFFDDLFGPYPFEAYGIAVVDGFRAALENQSLSIFGRDLLTEPIIVHELAHQWFGDHVSTTNWQDIWLNEGFASYAEWLWIEATEGPAALAVGITRERAQLAAAGFPPPGLPPAEDLFNVSVYRLGAMTLHALRLTIGDEAFFETLQTYTERHGGSTASTTDFIAVAEEISGQDLDDLFDAWLYGSAVPQFPTD